MWQLTCIDYQNVITRTSHTICCERLIAAEVFFPTHGFTHSVFASNIYILEMGGSDWHNKNGCFKLTLPRFDRQTSTQGASSKTPNNNNFLIIMLFIFVGKKLAQSSSKHCKQVLGLTAGEG